jgi:hypothetical protein
MNDMRFNQPRYEPEQRIESELKREPDFFSQPKRDYGRFVKPFLKWFLMIIAAVLIFAGIYFLWNRNNRPVDFDPLASDYYGVFLNNGQVYFGKPVKKTKSELVISDVHYFQAADQMGTSSSKYSIVKLGNELHGPTDKLYINSASILFYEQLRNDSQVVKTIKSFK